MKVTELTTHGTAAGGDAVARDETGKVVFVAGAMAGERVAVEVVREKKTHAFAKLVEVLDASEHRVEPICANVNAGCGGCGWAHMSGESQAAAKLVIVADSFERIAKLDAPHIRHSPPLAGEGFRTAMRAGVADGRACLRKGSSHELLPVDSCRVSHPLIEELLVEGRYEGAESVSMRVGANTGERIVVVTGDDARVSVPGDTTVVVNGTLMSGDHRYIHEEIAGKRFRISPDSFFQTRADGAARLVEIVQHAIAGHFPGVAPTTLVDLCAGVGLFAALVPAAQTIGVEVSAAAVADYAVNVGEPCLQSQFEQWRPTPATAVIADPARAGLGKQGAPNVVATGAAIVVLVSCDAGSLGRDAGLLAAAGYVVGDCTLIDMFPDTPHTETVTAFTKS